MEMEERGNKWQSVVSFVATGYDPSLWLTKCCKQHFCGKLRRSSSFQCPFPKSSESHLNDVSLFNKATHNGGNGKKVHRMASIEEGKSEKQQRFPKRGGIIGLLTVIVAGFLSSPGAAQALSLTQAVAGPLFDQLNPETPEWARVLVWLNFRAAVLLFVFIPLAIFFWSFRTEGKNDAIRRIMVGYWQASSLLMLTVFLNIAHVPYAAVTGLVVQGMIPITLYWWKDLGREAQEEKSRLASVFRAWRPVATITSIIGLLVQVPFQGCNTVLSPANAPLCAAWLEPPANLHRLLFSFVSEDVFGALGYAGVGIYVTYLLWLVVRVIPNVGREGRKDRNCVSSVSILKRLGWISPESRGN